MDPTEQRVEELERKLKELTFEFQKLKQSVVPPPASYVSKIKVHSQSQSAEEEEKKAAATQSGDARQKVIVISNRSQWKQMAMEYSQKMHLPKPTEIITENKDYNICWDYLSPKGCTRHDCRWTHTKLDEKDLHIAKESLKKNRFTAKVSIGDECAFGAGSSKRSAVAEAYRSLVQSMNIMERMTNLYGFARKKRAFMEQEKGPKSRLMEYAAKHGLGAPVTSYSSEVDLRQNVTIWKAKVVFSGRSVEVQDVRKKQAEQKCCQKLLEALKIGTPQ